MRASLPSSAPGPRSYSLRGLLPPQGEWDPSNPGAYIRLRDHVVNWELTYRNQHISRITRNWWYYLGRQHIVQDQAAFRQAAQGFVWRDIRQVRGSRVRPTTNKAAVQIDNEVARLSRKEFVPAIWTDSADPTVLTGSRVAKQVLDYYLDHLNWPEKRDYSHLVYTIEGSVWTRIGWDISQTRLTAVPVEGAHRCSACGEVLASRVVPRAGLEAAQSEGSLFNGSSIFDLEAPPERSQLDEFDVEVAGEPEAMVKDCPSCSAQGSLQAYDPTEDDYDSSDRFGRPLAEDLPAGAPDLDILHSRELFFSNAGLLSDPSAARVICRVVPREIEWLEERYPEFAEHFLPEPPQDLMRTHPILGETDYIRNHSPELDQGIFDNHMMTYEFAIQPYMEEDPEVVEGDAPLVPNQGRYVFMCGDYCVEDTALLIPYQDYKGRTKRLPRVFFHYARHRIRPGETVGNGLMDDLVSPQNRINHGDGQTISALDGFASPQVLAPRDSRINGPEWHTPGGNRILLYDLSPMNAQAKPEIFQAGSLPADLWRLREANAADIQEMGGGGEVELGQIPAGLKTTSGLVVAGDNMGQRRQPRERSLKRLYADMFKSILRMLAAFRTEEETYEVDAPGASMTKVHTFKGSDLCEQYNVRVTAEAGVEKDIYTREAAAEAKAEGVYDLSDPVARRRYLEMRGLPEINETFKRQVDRAQKAAGAFLDKGTLPPLDPFTQHPGIWYSTLGEIWLGDELAELQVTEGWNDLLPLVVGWEKELDDLIQKDVLARKFYAGMTPADAQGIYQQAIVDQQKTVALQKQAAALPVDPAMPAPPPPAPITPLPPEPVFIPPAYERRIYHVLCKLEGTQEDWDAEPATPDEEEAEKIKSAALHPNGLSKALTLERLKRFYCIYHAFRLHAEEREGKRMQGAPLVPMPGGDPLTNLSAQASAQGRQSNTPTLPEPPPELPGAAANAAAGGTVPKSSG